MQQSYNAYDVNYFVHDRETILLVSFSACTSFTQYASLHHLSHIMFCLPALMEIAQNSEILSTSWGQFPASEFIQPSGCLA